MNKLTIKLTINRQPTDALKLFRRKKRKQKMGDKVHIQWWPWFPTQNRKRERETMIKGSSTVHRLFSAPEWNHRLEWNGEWKDKLIQWLKKGGK